MVVCLAVAACLTQCISTMFSSEVAASIIAASFATGEVQQVFHRTHGITCRKCWTCRWLLFVRAFLFVTAVLIIRDIAIRLSDNSCTYLDLVLMNTMQIPNNYVDNTPGTMTHGKTYDRLWNMLTRWPVVRCLRQMVATYLL